MESQEIKTGGVGMTVKIDETHWTSAKYGRGRDMVKEHMWIFGGRERGMDNRFCVSLGPGGRKNRSTLEPLIIKHIRKGSTIISDCWGAYNPIESLCDIDGESMNYKHLTVNHRVGCVNPTTRTIHTKAAERFWGNLKDKIKGCGHGWTIEQNIFKYLILRKHGDNAFHKLLIECGKLFPYEI